jgi:hypothetical protein
MKKNLFAMIIIAGLFSLTACQKEIIDPMNQKTSFKENGYTWAGWDIKNPITKFDTIELNIYIMNNWNTAGSQLQGKELVAHGPKTIYAVQPFTQGNFHNMKNDLERRGWKIAPLSYYLALSIEYGTNTSIFSLYCLNIPEKAVFNGPNPEEFTAQVYENFYDQQTGRSYRASIEFIPFSSQYGGIKVLCYR